MKRKSNKDYVLDNVSLWEKIVENKINQKIEELLQGDHSFGMILDYMRIYHPDIISDCKLGRWKSILHRQGYKCNVKAYNSKPSEWKLQYRYTKEELRKFSSDGQKKTIEKRKANADFNPPQGVQYWIDNHGLGLVEAKDAATAYKRSNSPRCVEFYTKKGVSRNDAEMIISRNAIRGALASLKKTQKPTTELAIAQYFDCANIRYSCQYKIDLTSPTSRRKKFFLYDFFLPDWNLLLEVQGTYWHADPTIFKPDDTLYFPGGNTFKASQVWSADKEKEEKALEKGYIFATIWEREIKNSEIERVIQHALRACKDSRASRST